MSKLSFDKAVYDIEAVKRAAYDLPKECCPQITTTDDTITIQFMSLVDIHKDEFSHRVLDHQLRLDAEAKFGLIRTILVAQAIDPRGDLDAIIESVSPSE